MKADLRLLARICFPSLLLHVFAAVIRGMSDISGIASSPVISGLILRDDRLSGVELVVVRFQPSEEVPIVAPTYLLTDY